MIRYQESVTYTCNTGYTLSGMNTSTCAANGTILTPSCLAVNCTIPNITNGQQAVSEISFQQRANYSCNAHHVLVGDARPTCQANRTLTSTPTCKAVTCKVPTISNGKSSQTGMIRYQESVTYTCNTGHTLSGVSTSTCAADGTILSPSCLDEPNNPQASGTGVGAGPILGAVFGFAAFLGVVLAALNMKRIKEVALIIPKKAKSQRLSRAAANNCRESFDADSTSSPFTTNRRETCVEGINLGSSLNVVEENEHESSNFNASMLYSELNVKEETNGAYLNTCSPPSHRLSIVSDRSNTSSTCMLNSEMNVKEGTDEGYVNTCSPPSHRLPIVSDRSNTSNTCMLNSEMNVNEETYAAYVNTCSAPSPRLSMVSDRSNTSNTCMLNSQLNVKEEIYEACLSTGRTPSLSHSLGRLSTGSTVSDI
ncbi:complement component receptor 1-like protein [Sycon ciliatum]|uniref:complement component receptor 1-like protein n=1 Tax=Sycon ciliatum TaxID=27933 RepID=UPI0031F64A56